MQFGVGRTTLWRYRLFITEIHYNNTALYVECRIVSCHGSHFGFLKYCFHSIFFSNSLGVNPTRHMRIVMRHMSSVLIFHASEFFRHVDVYVQSCVSSSSDSPTSNLATYAFSSRHKSIPRFLTPLSKNKLSKFSFHPCLVSRIFMLMQSSARLYLLQNFTPEIYIWFVL